MSDRHAALLLLTVHLTHLVSGFGTVYLKMSRLHHIFTNISAKSESTFISTILSGHYFVLSLSFVTVDLAVFTYFLHLK